MNSIRDYIRAQAIVREHLGNDPRIAMVQRTHGVEGMGSVPGSRLHRVLRDRQFRVRMSNADAHVSLGGFRNHCHRAGEFGGDRHHSHMPLGVHLEGPWLSGKRAGAQPPAALSSPDLAGLERLLAAGPPVLLTVAPELPGALEVIERAAAAGVRVALGHSDATYDEAAAGVRAGARHITHCFNAMSGLHHREPGLVGAALDLPELTVELIADGVHVHPAAARVLWRAVGADRVCLVSDAVDVELSGDVGVRLADGTLAGSRVGLDGGVRNLVAWGIPLVDALQMASRSPALAAGRSDLGSLALGSPADLVLLDADLGVQTTMVGGEIRWQR